jgi:hypothetical protein
MDPAGMQFIFNRIENELMVLGWIGEMIIKK